MGKCVLCDEEFNGRRNKKYCSSICYQRAKSKRYLKKINHGVFQCEFCTVEFIKKKNNQKYCSHECSSNGKREHLGILRYDYFEKIDCAVKAYWLGFLCADGYINKKGNKLQICLSTKDESLIDKFIEEVGGSEEDKKYYGPYKTSGKQVHYYVSNREFAQNLINHGCVNKKSLVMTFPKIDEKFYFNFLLGYYDGDGTEGSTMICSGSDEFLKDVKDVFGISYNVKLRGSCFYLNVGANVYREMIGSMDYGLSRKRYLKHQRNYAPKSTNWERPKKFNVSKEDLEKLVWEIPTSKIAKQFGVSDNAISKRCKKFGISKPPRGYWQKQNVKI
jgi:hypothetical protein